MDGVEDTHVAGAAAEVSGQAFLDLFEGWVWVLREEMVSGEDHAGSADAALGSASLEEASLDGVEFFFVGYAFYGGDFGAPRLEDGDQAGVDQLTVHEDGAGAAFAFAAAFFGAGEVEVLAEDVEEELSGLFRWTSGFPYTIFNNPADYPTDWYWEGAAMPTVSHVKSGAYHSANGNVNLFPDPATAENLFSPALPGQVGVRNFVRGDGFFGIDLGLSKRWKMPWNENHSLALRWEVFNVTNSTRFDFNDQNSSSASESNNSIAVPNFGNYTHLMTNPRVMQFALRYEF